NAEFNSAFSNQPNLAGNASAGGIWMTGTVGQNFTISDSGFTLTLQGNTINGTAGLGILVDNANAFTLTISASLKVGNAQTWRNSSGNLLTISGAVNTAKALTIDGTGNTTISGVVSSSGALTKAGTGTLTLSNTGDTYTGQLTVQETGAGTLTLSGANTYAGKTSIQNGTLSVSSLNKVTGGSASSSLGAPTTVANGTIDIGSTTNSGTLLYTGSGETTDRVINLAGTTGGAVIQNDGTGALTFSSNLTATGAGSKTLTLQGSNTGSNTISGI